jgi:hypothetical protein
MKMKKSKFLNTYSWFFLLLFCGSCVKEISYELGDKENVLVIYGVLSDKPGRRIFRVTRTNPFEKQVDSNPISGAKLFVIDSKGKKYGFVELDPGSYLFQDTLFQPKAGETYFLDAVVPNAGHYRSDLEVMPGTTTLDRAYPGVQKIENDTRLQLLVDTRISSDPQGVYLRWGVTRVWQRTSVDFGTIFMDRFRFRPPIVCYFTIFPEPNGIRLFSSKRQDQFELKEQEILNITATDSKFFEKNVFEIIQYRISFNAHEYWSNLNKVTNQAGTIFDPPPATVRGNIYNVDNPNDRTLGYFELASLDTAYVSVDATFFTPFYIPDPCTPDYTNRSLAPAPTYYYTAECAYCTNIKNHSTIQPKFWFR